MITQLEANDPVLPTHHERRGIPENLLAALPAEELANLVDEKAADPDDKHMPDSVRTVYRCEKDPTGDLNRDSLINCINKIALNTLMPRRNPEILRPTGLGNEDRGQTSTVHRPQHQPSKFQDQAGEQVHPAKQETAGVEGGL